MKKRTKAKRLILVDNYDSFTYNLLDYFVQLGTDCRVVRNDELSIAAYQRVSFDGLVLSPGPKRPQDAGLLMDIVDNFHRVCPVLGICLGHQAIGSYFGARLIQAPEPRHGKTSEVFHEGHPLFSSVPSPFTAMRYHSLIIQDLEGTGIRPIATTKDGIPMAIAHAELPLLGVQFHPESIGTPFGMQILRNWIEQIPIQTG